LQWFLEDPDKVPQVQRINADIALFLLERAVHIDRQIPESGSRENHPPHYAVANHHHSCSYLEGGQAVMPFCDGHTYRSLEGAIRQKEECLKEGYSSEEITIYRLVEVPNNLC
jgi:hypothetical protein